MPESEKKSTKPKEITRHPITEVEVDPVLPGLIFQQISAVMADIGAIGKDRENKHQKYKFRGIDDVYNSLHEVLAKHKIFTVPNVLKYEREERPSKQGGTLIIMILTVEYTIFAEDGSSVTSIVIGEAMDAGGDKASNKAMSAAHKYALLQLFCIPTEDPKDTENGSPEVGDVKKEKISQTLPGAGKANKAMEDFIAGQRSKGDSRDPKDLEHDFNQQFINEKCRDAGVDYKTFKEFLDKKQDGMEPPRKFVGEIFGNLSFMAGKPEDVKDLVTNIDTSITACKAWVKDKTS